MNAAERAKLKDKELVDLKCNKCGSDYQLTFGRYRKIRKSGNFLCKTCMKQFHDEQVKKTWNSKSKEEMDRINDKKREAYNNKSEEEKQKQIGKMLEYTKNMSEEEKKLKHENLMKAKREYEDNLSEEEKFKRSQHASENMKNFWANVDDDYKTYRVSLLHEGNKEWWNNMTQEEQDAHMGLVHAGRDKWWAELSSEEKTDWVKNLSNQHAIWWKLLTPEELYLISERSAKNNKEWWVSLSDEERQIINEKRKLSWNNKSEEEKNMHRQISINYWDSKSKEEKINHVQPMLLAQKEWWYNLSNDDKEDYLDKQWETIIKNYTPNLSELEFINLLNIDKINYECQYRSKIIHPDFYKLFPKNIITGTNFVSGKHTWDFIIHIKDKEILVDVDGSIHHKDDESIISTRKGEKLKFKDCVKFYDNQRIYKTDGLDAYAIKFSNDILDINSQVVNIKTNKIFSLQQFLSLINSYNLTSKEIKEALKNK